MKTKTVDDKINLKTLVIDAKREYQLNKDTTWVKKILEELNENAHEKSLEYYVENSNLDIELLVTRKSDPTYGDTLLIEAKVDTTYFTKCVKSNQIMQEKLTLEVKTCFIDEHFKESAELKEETDIFIYQELRELYFYKLFKAPVAEMIHEQIFLNLNYHPALGEEFINPEGNKYH